MTRHIPPPDLSPSQALGPRLRADLRDDGDEDDTLDLRPVSLPPDDDDPSVVAGAVPTTPGAAVDALAARALQGDKEAWNTLIRMHNAAVIGVIMSYRVPRERAQELAQEAWIKLYLKVADGVITVLKLPGLILREAGWRALDELRKGEHRLERLDAPVGQGDDADGRRRVDLVADPADSPEQAALVRGELLLGRRIFLALPDRQRQVAWLVITKALSHAEVAAHLADNGDPISPLTSKFTLSKARKRMRAIRDMPDTAACPMREAYLMRHADGRQPGGIALELGLTQPKLDALLQDAFQRIKSAGGC